MVFDQTVYVANASESKVYVRTTYEKWQQLKFSSEIKLLNGTSVGGGLNLEQAASLTEGYTAVAPHHTLKMIGSFFSADIYPPVAGAAAASPPVTATTKDWISRNYRVPNNHSIIITPQHTVRVVRSGVRWREQCRQYCVYIIQEKQPSTLCCCWTKQPAPPKETCSVCKPV